MHALVPLCACRRWTIVKRCGAPSVLWPKHSAVRSPTTAWPPCVTTCPNSEPRAWSKSYRTHSATGCRPVAIRRASSSSSSSSFEERIYAPLSAGLLCTLSGYCKLQQIERSNSTAHTNATSTNSINSDSRCSSQQRLPIGCCRRTGKLLPLARALWP